MARLRVVNREERVHRAWRSFRAERDRRLSNTDWVVIKYYESGLELPEEWKQYRQALRDLPNALTDEEVLSGNIPWPVQPNTGLAEEGDSE